MKAIKRTVAALLATLMLATSTSFTLAAEEYSDAEAVAVAKVNAAGVMTGTDKGFEPSKTLTRAEAAAIMVRMKGIAESSVKASAGTTLFTDVPASHWAAGYINVASNYGLIVGVGAGLFAPDKEVSVAEFYTMAVRALGAGKLVDSEGTWPTNYVNFAIENKLSEDVAQVYAETATRISAAIIVANTLEADMWEKSAVKSNGEITWEAKDKTIVEDVLKINAFKANTDKETLELKVAKVSNTDKVINDTIDCVDTLDLSNIKVGMTYQVWTNKDGEIIGLWIAKDSNKVEYTQIVDYKNNEITLKVDGKDKKYDLDSTKINITDGIDVVYNETETGAAAQVKKNKNANGVAYIDGKKVTALYITEFVYYGVIDEVTSTKVKFNTADIEGENCGNFNINNEDNEYFLTKDGSAMKYTDLKEGDAIKYYTVSNGASTKYVAEVITDSAEGKVTAKGTDYIKLDGKKYDLADAANISWFNLDDEVRVWMNAAGKIIMEEDIEEAAGDIAIVKYFRAVSTRSGYTFDVELVTMDGNSTDRLELDIDETIDNFEDEAKDGTFTASAVTLASTAITFTDGDNTIDDLTATYTLGDVVCYAINGDKVSFKPVSTGDKAEYVKVTANGTSKELVAGSKYTYLTDGASTPNTLYYLTDSTKVFNIKPVSGTADAYDSKVETVEVSELDDMDIAVAYYVAGVDKDTKEIKYLVLPKAVNVARTAEANFALIIAKADCKYDNKDAFTVDVIYADGTKAEGLIAQSGETTGIANVEIGNFVDIQVKDDMIVDADLLTSDAKDMLTPVVGDKIVTKVVTSNRIKVAATNVTVVKADNSANKIAAGVSLDGQTTTDDITSGTYYKVSSNYFSTYDKALDSQSFTGSEVLVADDVLVVLKDGSKYTAKDLSDIEEYDDALSKNYVISSYVTYTDDDDTEVALIIYSELD